MTDAAGRPTHHGGTAMTIETADASGPYRRRLALHVDRVVRASGIPTGLRPHLLAALGRCPRHLFVDRYQIDARGPVLDIATGDAERHYGLIYNDVALGHVDSAGWPLPSTNSPPSTLLHMLEVLDLRPGQTVLEIGSGSGWALGLIAQAVGPAGRAVGVEIIPELAERSRRSLAVAGIGNATVITADGADGWRGAGPYDRVIFTASTWSLRPTFFDQLARGGRFVAPFEIKGPGVDVMAFTRGSTRELRGVQTAPAFFVRGAGGLASGAPPRRLAEFPLWHALANREVLRLPMPLGGLGFNTARSKLFGSTTVAFRSFLTKTQPRLVVFAAEPDDLAAPFVVLGDPAGAIDILGFGLADETDGSLALCTPGEIVGYGNPIAARELITAYRDWTDLLMPGGEAFDARLVPVEDAPAPGQGQWVETRGEVAFVWSIKKDWVRASDLVSVQHR
jgi:protein-L-isoaspartate(D-aspartate) O-methyltransferase